MRDYGIKFMPFLGLRLRSTKKHKKYWANRKIDWQKAYLETWNHPHRFVISNLLKMVPWLSLVEVGCGPGPNLVNIVKTIQNRQVGGIDINPEAIELARKTFPGGMFKVGTGDDVMLSDKSTDVVLSDMHLIYVGPREIKKYLGEIKRIARNYVVLSEFHSTSFWQRLWVRLTTGYNAHNYKKLLDKMGFYDVMMYKMKPEDWPGGGMQEKIGYIILARVPKY